MAPVRLTRRTRDRRPLRYAPPALVNPITKNLTNTVRSLTSPSDWIEDQDYIVKLPPYPLTAPYINLNFRGARNIVITGGEIYIPIPAFNYQTGQSVVDGFPKSTATCTATSGTFRVKHTTSTAVPFAGPVLNVATADGAAIQAAIEAQIGAGHVTITGPVGGPWVSTPALFDPAMGRLTFETTSLVGGTITVANASWTDLGPFRVKDWKGTLHIEGVYMHGPGCGEGLNPESGYDGAILRTQNCRLAPEFYRYHNDHQHPDAVQPYRGPAVWQADRCDFFSPVQGSILQPATNGTPADTNPQSRQPSSIDGWRFRDVFWKAGWNAKDPRKAEFALFVDQYPSGFAPNFENCFAWSDGPPSDGRLDWTAGVLPKPVPSPWYHYFNYSKPAPSGLTLGQAPPRGDFCDPARGECGLNYVSPGYEAPPADAVPAPAYVASAIYDDAPAGAGVVVPLPAGIANGDLLLAEVISYPSGAAVTPPAGWTQIGPTITNSSGATDYDARLYAKTHAGAAAAAWTFASTPEWVTATTWAYRGASPPAVLASAASAVASASPWVAPSVISTGPGQVQTVIAFFEDSSTVIPAPAGFSTRPHLLFERTLTATPAPTGTTDLAHTPSPQYGGAWTLLLG